MTNPYRGLPDHCFWSRAVTAPAPGHVDPMGGGAVIRPGEPVATMGSCFAQHLSRHVARTGLTWMQTEPAPEGMSAAAAAARNFGVFTARFGNVYTVRQALQLFDRAFGAFRPAEDVWAAPAGGPPGWVDAFRPTIEPLPRGSAEQVRAEAAAHLGCVRRMFEEARWLVFTLGLTEAWQSRLDGAVYPVAPGVAGGAFDAARHAPVNFTAGEVRDDLFALVERLAGVNPGCRVILTVSPVPLIATHAARHVMVSTAFSKAALRVAADEAERRFPHVTYFPSYEIITGPMHEGRYWADDLRQVTELGVAHVMRVFGTHFLGQAAAPATAAPLAAPASAVVCDEEVIEAALRASGARR